MTPDFFFYVFNLILSFSTCSESFEKICAWELLGANVLNRALNNLAQELRFQAWLSRYTLYNRTCIKLYRIKRSPFITRSAFKDPKIISLNYRRLVRAYESLWDTGEILETLTGFQANECGFAERLSFSSIRTKHKASLDTLPCVSKQLLWRRGNSIQQHLNEIAKNKQGKPGSLIFAMQERRPVITEQHDRAILK